MVDSYTALAIIFNLVVKYVCVVSSYKGIRLKSL